MSLRRSGMISVIPRQRPEKTEVGPELQKDGMILADYAVFFFGTTLCMQNENMRSAVSRLTTDTVFSMLCDMESRNRRETGEYI